MDLKYLTQENLDHFKALVPHDEKLQAITLDELLEHAKGKDLSKVGAQYALAEPAHVVGAAACPIACAGVVVDVVLIVIGAAAIRSLVKGPAIEEVARIIEPAVPEITKLARILASDAAAIDKAWAMFSLVKSLYTAGMVEAIILAMFRDVPYYDWVLYGLLAVAEIAAMCLTDGASEVAVIASELVLCGFLVSDSYKVEQACL